MHFWLWLLLSELREPFLPLWFMEGSARVLFCAWLFAVGASIGSFLNVVVYRLPRGLSLTHPGSRCPACGRAIRGRDNLPVLSWLILRGKCRDCRAPISPRYYYVELVMGLVFVLVAAFEFYLPQPTWVGSGLIRPPLHSSDALPFWTTYAIHVGLVASLLAAALIDLDGWRMPRPLLAPVIVAALATGIAWPESRRIAAMVDSTLAPWKAGLIDGAAGIAAGMACGVLFGLAWRGGSRGESWPRSGPVMLLAAVGAMLGWQRVVIIASLASVAFAVLVIVLRLAPGRGAVPLAGIVAALTGWIAVEWAAVLMPLVLGLAEHPATGGGIAALAIAASAIVAGAAATPDYHAAQVPSPADHFPELPPALDKTHTATQPRTVSQPAAAPEQAAGGTPSRENPSR